MNLTKPVLGILCFWGIFASAEVYTHPSQFWRRAGVISPSQQVWSFQSYYKRSDQRFSNAGQLQDLGEIQGRKVTWRQLMDAEPDARQRAEIENYIRNQNLNEDSVAATASYQFVTEDVGFVLDWAFGMTRRWMVGFQLPVGIRKTSTRTDVSFSTGLDQGVRRGTNASPLSVSDPVVRQRVEDLSENNLRNSGYDSLPDQKTSFEWHDVTLLSQVELLKGYNLEWSLQQLVRLPTVRNPSASEYPVLAGEDGQIDAGLISLTDFRLRRWTLGVQLGYLMQFAGDAKIHPPNLSILPINSSRPIEISRDLGDWTWAGVDVQYQLSQRYTANVNYSYLEKSEDKIRSDELNSNQIDFLTQNSEQEIHRAGVRLGYEWSPREARNSIENKWIITLGYDAILRGRNSINANEGSLTVTTYF